MWQFWRRHRRKILVSLGICGSGYLLYKLYDVSRHRLSELERQLDDERESEELLKTQMQTHFENIQRIANTTTLPHSMLCLNSRVGEELDLLHLTERLKKGKGQPNTLTYSEKLELWDRLKILSFTRLVLSVWAMTILSLYIRVQVNILGRHLYIDTARDLEASQHVSISVLISFKTEFIASPSFTLFVENCGLWTYLYPPRYFTMNFRNFILEFQVLESAVANLLVAFSYIENEISL